MGMQIAAAGRKGGRRRRGVPRYGAMADINMTPFIDVMLVLLIIFMVAAPLLASGVPIDLPQTAAAPLNVDHTPITVTVNEKGEIFVLDQPVSIDEMANKIKDVAKNDPDERIYVKGDKTVNYGRVAEVMSLITSAGFKKVALVTEGDKH